MLSDYLISTTVTVFIYMNVLFIIAQIKRDDSIVDSGWGLGFVMIVLCTLFMEPFYTARNLLVSTLVIIWGLRLSLHILFRNLGKPEDLRYAAWRRNWGKWFLLRSYFQIFMLPGLFMLLIAFPVVLINFSPRQGFTFLDIIGLLVWITGFFFEAAGDHQLRVFKRNPANKNRILNQGLWRYTRHPNYFGEALMWWGIFLIALSALYGWSAVISPLIITLLLTKGSGVPMLQKKYRDRPEYIVYQQRTNSFFPWFPKEK